MSKVVFGLSLILLGIFVANASISCPSAYADFNQNYVLSGGEKYTILGGGGILRSPVTDNPSNCAIQCLYQKSSGGGQVRTWNGISNLKLTGGDWVIDCNEVAKSASSTGCGGSCSFYAFVYDSNALSQDTQLGANYDANSKIAIEKTKLVSSSCPSDVNVPTGEYTLPYLEIKNIGQTVDCSAVKFTTDPDLDGNAHTFKGQWKLKDPATGFITPRGGINLPVYTIDPNDGLTMINYGVEQLNNQGKIYFTGDFVLKATIECGAKCTSFASCDAKKDAPYVKVFECPPYTITGPATNSNANTKRGFDDLDY
jgi:hypothetical protein